MISKVAKRRGDHSRDRPESCRTRMRGKPDSVYRPEVDNFKSGRRLFVLAFGFPKARAILPGSLTLAVLNAPLFDLAPCRVWLFSLRQLPQGLPFPASGS